MALLDAGDLGDDRLVREINKGLRAQKSEFYQGDVVATVDDNTTQQRARELLARVRGRDKITEEVHHSGSIDAAVRIYLPDNGRSDAGSGD